MLVWLATKTTGPSSRFGSRSLLGRLRTRLTKRKIFPKTRNRHVVGSGVGDVPA